MTNGIQTNGAPVEEEPPVPSLQATEVGYPLFNIWIVIDVVQVQRDREGFSVAPPAVDEISRVQQEAAAG